MRQYNLECLCESCGWCSFCAFVLPVDRVRCPAEYAIGSPVTPGSVYSSRPSWIFSVINFLKFYGGWVQLGVLSQSQILDSMLPPQWLSLRHNLPSWSSPAILFTFYVLSFVPPHSSELNLPPWRPGVFCSLRRCFVSIVQYLDEFLMYLWGSWKPPHLTPPHFFLLLFMYCEII